MATLWISEFQTIGSGGVQVMALPPIAQQNLTVGAETDATAFGSQTRLVRLVTDTACHIRVAGSAPTAVTTDLYLPARVPEYFAVTPGNILSVIAAA